MSLSEASQSQLSAATTRTAKSSKIHDVNLKSARSRRLVSKALSAEVGTTTSNPKRGRIRTQRTRKQKQQLRTEKNCVNDEVKSEKTRRNSAGFEYDTIFYAQQNLPPYGTVCDMMAGYTDDTSQWSEEEYIPSPPSRSPSRSPPIPRAPSSSPPPAVMQGMWFREQYPRRYGIREDPNGGIGPMASSLLSYEEHPAFHHHQPMQFAHPQGYPYQHQPYQHQPYYQPHPRHPHALPFSFNPTIQIDYSGNSAYTNGSPYGPASSSPPRLSPESPHNGNRSPGPTANEFFSIRRNPLASSERSRSTNTHNKSSQPSAENTQAQCLSGLQSLNISEKGNDVGETSGETDILQGNKADEILPECSEVDPPPSLATENGNDAPVLIQPSLSKLSTQCDY